MAWCRQLVYVPIDLLGERFVPPFQPGREPVPRLEQQGKVDLVVVRVVQIEIPCITQADVVPLVEVMVGVVLWWLDGKHGCGQCQRF